MSDAELVVQQFNRDHPVGTPVTYWPGTREGTGRASRTRTPAWLVCGHPCVSVEGYPGGIALTHVEVTPAWLVCDEAAAYREKREREQAHG